MYAQVFTRPDITFVIGVLSRYLSNPRMQHWKTVKRVMRYLKRTKWYTLTYQKFENLEIIGNSHFDFAGCQDNKRSTSRYIFILAGGTISWKSTKQTLVASSTMVAEFIVCFEESNHGIWLRNFATGLCVVDDIEIPLRIYCDNESAVQYSNNNRSTTKLNSLTSSFWLLRKKFRINKFS